MSTWLIRSSGSFLARVLGGAVGRVALRRRPLSIQRRLLAATCGPLALLLLPYAVAALDLAIPCGALSRVGLMFALVRNPLASVRCRLSQRHRSLARQSMRRGPLSDSGSATSESSSSVPEPQAPPSYARDPRRRARAGGRLLVPTHVI